MTVDDVSKAYLLTTKDEDEDLRRKLQGVGCHQLRGDRRLQGAAGVAGVRAALPERLQDLVKLY